MMDDSSVAVHYLITRFSSLGDIVKFLPASTCLKMLHPQATITWITSPRFAPLLRLSPDIDYVVELDPWSWRAPLWSLYRYMVTLWKLRRSDFDVGIDFHSLWSSVLLIRCCHTKKQISAAIPNRLGFFSFAHIPLNATKARRPEDFYLSSLALLGVPHIRTESPLLHDAAAEAEVERKLQSLSLRNDRPLVVLHPGSAGALKCWPLENFLDLHARLVSELDVDLVFLIGPKEQTQHKVLSQLGIPLIENLSLPMLVALLRRTDVLVDHDSGPLQLAGLLHRRTVGIFGPSIPEMHRPYGEKSIIVRGSSECTACFVPFRFKSGCERGDVECLRTISVTQVLRAVQEQLAAQQKEIASASTATSAMLSPQLCHSE